MARRAGLCSRVALLCVVMLALFSAQQTAAKSPPGKKLLPKAASPKRSPSSPRATKPPVKAPPQPATKPSRSPPRKPSSPKPAPKSPPKPRKSPPKLPTSPPRKSSPKRSPPRLVPSPLASPRTQAAASPKRTGGPSSSPNYSPVSSKLPCYPGPYTECKASLPGGPALQRAPSSNINQFVNTTSALLPPGTYTTFIIAANEGYYLDGTYTFETLIVNGYLTCGQPGGTQTDISVTATYISVAGIFHCGKADRPYDKKVTITMRSAPSGGGDGQKHIAVTGWLMMVGSARKAWTQIADTVRNGTTSFTTTEPVDWLPGERIVMTSTSFNPNHTEEAIIASVSPFGSGSQVTVTTPFQYSHWGTLQEYPSDKGAVTTLDERAEVALLNRNIVIQGDDASTLDGQGAFLTMFEGGNGWYRDVLFFRVGQLGKLGRYPAHWHLTGDRMGNFISNSVIYKSWNRCMSIHATNYVKVTSNVCYDHIGHGFLIEDSCEHSNVFRYNLGIRTRLPSSMAAGVFDTDTTHLATFWITNTLNHFIGNVAAASDFAAFWIMLPTRPIHLCAVNGFFPDMNVQTLSMGRFDDNVGHSSNVGLGIEAGICDTPRAPSCSGIYQPMDVPQVKRLRAYKCTNSFRTGWITVDKQMMFDRCAFADNGGSVLLAGAQILSNTLIVGQSANTIYDTTPPARMGFGLYDGPSGLLNTHFAGFERAGFRCLLPVTSAWKKWNNFVQGVTFDAAIPRRSRYVQSVNRTLAEMFNQGLVDVDGSLLGADKAGWTLMTVPGGINNTILREGRQDPDFNVPSDGGCTMDTELNVWTCPPAVTWGSIRVNHFFPPIAAARIVDVIRSDGKQVTTDASIRIWYQFNAILNRGLSYRVVYRDANSITSDASGNPLPFEVAMGYVDPGATVAVTLENLPAGRTWFAYDCVRKASVLSGQAGVTSLSLTLAATGQASGGYPNLKYASARIRVCTATAAACLC